jgi:hypothetical protein
MEEVNMFRVKTSQAVDTTLSKQIFTGTVSRQDFHPVFSFCNASFVDIAQRERERQRVITASPGFTEQISTRVARERDGARISKVLDDTLTLMLK